MIRRDYILRMIEEFAQALVRMRSLKTEQRWDEARETLQNEFQRMLGVTPEALVRFSETELLACLIKTESTLAVREKTLMLSALLKEAGDLAVVQNRSEEGRALYLKGLHLLLDALGQNEPSEVIAFVPQVEVFVSALEDAPLPVQTYGILMQHFERTGQFGKAEDALFSLLELETEHSAVLESGISFYQRLQSYSDAQLEEGNLPRSEVLSGLAELRQRLSTQPA